MILKITRLFNKPALKKNNSNSIIVGFDNNNKKLVKKSEKLFKSSNLAKLGENCQKIEILLNLMLKKSDQPF